MDHTASNLDAAYAQVCHEISRTDTKASLLLAFNGAAFAGLVATADMSIPVAAQVIRGIAALALGVAVALLLLAVRPNLGRGRERNGFPVWAEMLHDDDIREAMKVDYRPGHMRVLAQIAVRKYTALRRSVDLTLSALALLGIAATLAFAG